MRNWSTFLVSFVVVFSMGACSNQGDVLKPLPGGSLLVDAPPAPQDASANALVEVLHAKGYEGVGLKYESQATIDLLTEVFSDPKTSNRQIALIYTGVTMSYDPSYKSLTVGGGFTPESILQFIEKHVPAKPESSKEQKK